MKVSYFQMVYRIGMVFLHLIVDILIVRLDIFR